MTNYELRIEKDGTVRISPLCVDVSHRRRGSAFAKSVCWGMILLLSIISCLTSHVFAQDLHFTQFFASPLTTSPSNAGFMNGDWRVGGNFKSQWPWATSPNISNYRTFAIYGDVALLRGKLPGKDWLGVGLVVLNDRAGDGELKVNKFQASAAYHKSFGISGKYILSTGIGLSYVAKSIDYGKLYFNDQWDPNNLFFDQGFTTSEPVDEDALHYIDLSAGTHFTYVHSKKFNVSTGLSVFHLNKPKESFPGRDNRLGMRPLVNVIAYTKISDRVHLEPGFMWMYQMKAQEYIIDLLAGFTFLNEGKFKNSIVFLGAAGRPKDAFAPMVGFQYKTLRIIMNYDVNVSSLQNASNNNGGFEISVVYTGQRSKEGIRMIPCPRL